MLLFWHPKFCKNRWNNFKMKRTDQFDWHSKTHSGKRIKEPVSVFSHSCRKQMFSWHHTEPWDGDLSHSCELCWPLWPLRLRTWSTWRFWSVRTLRRPAFRSGSRRTGSGAPVLWRICQTAAWRRSREPAASPQSPTTTTTTRPGLWTTSESCRWRWDAVMSSVWQVFSDRMWCQHYHRMFITST